MTLKPGWSRDLQRLHDTPGRHYHTFQHVEALLGHWRTVDEADLWDDRVATWLAAALHDAVYVVGAETNEAASAALAPAWIATWVVDAPVDVDAVQALILATAHHGAQAEFDRQTALFVDCDMAILGADPERFERYEAQIRAEWEPLVGPVRYAEGRRTFLARVLAGPIFRSEFWRARLLDRARTNLTRALGQR